MTSTKVTRFHVYLLSFLLLCSWQNADAEEKVSVGFLSTTKMIDAYKIPTTLTDGHQSIEGDLVFIDYHFSSTKALSHALLAYSYFGDPSFAVMARIMAVSGFVHPNVLSLASGKTFFVPGGLKGQIDFNDLTTGAFRVSLPLFTNGQVSQILRGFPQVLKNPEVMTIQTGEAKSLELHVRELPNKPDLLNNALPVQQIKVKMSYENGSSSVVNLNSIRSKRSCMLIFDKLARSGLIFPLLQ
jgi:hypothetical protein